MPTFRITAPDGTVYNVTGPDGSTQEQALAQVQAQHAPAQHVNSPAMTSKIDSDAISQDAKAGPSMMGEIGHQIGNLAAGAVRGAGSIGATLITASSKLHNATLTPAGRALEQAGGYDGSADGRPTLTSLVTGQVPLSADAQRRADMDSALTSMGADMNSPAAKVGKLGGEIAGTAGAGPLIAGTLRSAPVVGAVAPNLLRAIETAGMSGGTATGAANPLLRVAGSAINGGASAGLVDPQNTTVGAGVGAALPVVARVAGAAGNAIGSGISSLADSSAKRLMQSAIKPTIAQLRSGDADVAVQTLLDNGINPTKGGVEKIRALIDDKNTAIANAISSSNATIPKQNVISALAGVKQKFGSQVSPTSDLAAIQGVEDDFTAHPNFPGADIPIQAAQDMKQGTYSVLRGKYGQVGSAETEAQKGLARGLKDEIASAVPAVGPLNAEESRLLTTLSVTERRALLEANKNPGGLALLAHDPVTWAAFMADKSALFKSLAARAVNSAKNVPGAVQNAIGAQPALSQLGYRAAPNALTGQ